MDKVIDEAVKALKAGDVDYAKALLEDVREQIPEAKVTININGDMSPDKLEALADALRAALADRAETEGVHKDKDKDKAKGKGKDDEEEEEEEDGKKKKKKGKKAFPGAATPFAKKGEAGHEDCEGDCDYEHAEAVTEAANAELISEIFSGRIEEALEGPNTYKVTLIEAGMSKNRNFWSPQILQSSQRLFEGVRAFADHPTKSELQERPERSIKDIIGWYEAVRFYPTGMGGTMKANLHLLEGPLADSIRQAHSQGKGDLIQLSVNISGKRVPRSINGIMAREVTEIHRVHSVDAVTEASAGGSIDHLVASENTSKEVEELMKLDNISPEDLLAAIEGRDDLRTAVVEKFAPSSEGSEETKEDKTTESEDASETESVEETKTETEEESTEKVQESKDPGEVQRLTEAVEELQTARLHERSKAELERQLAASDLPKPIQDKVRNRYEGKAFEAKELEQEIKAEQETFKQLSVGSPPASVPWEATGGETQDDRFHKAMEGLLAGENIDGVPAFRSIRHAYSVITGKSAFDITGYDILAEAAGYDSGIANQRLLEATAFKIGDFTAILGDSITRRALIEYRFPQLQEWRRVANSVPTSDLREQKRERLGEFYLLKHEATVAAGESVTYADLTGQVLPEVEAIYTPTKAHGQASLNLEVIINDDLGKFRNIPKMLGRAAAATIYVTVFDFIKTNPAESTYLTGGATDRLFEIDSNRAPGNVVNDVASVNGTLVALDDANLSDAQVRFSIQQAPVSSSAPYGGAISHSFLAGEPAQLIVAPTNRAVGRALMTSDNKVGTSNNHEVNIHKGSLDLMVIPYWETAADVVVSTNTLAPKNMWFVTARPNEIPMIEVGFLAGREEPEIFTQDLGTPVSGEMFTKDVITYKVRHFWGANPIDHRGMIGATTSQ